MKVCFLELEYRLTPETYDYVKQFERDHDLGEFYQRVKNIQILCLIDDANFFNKFKQCEILFFCTKESPHIYFNSPDLFSRVKDMIFLTLEFGSMYGNEIFDLLPKYCGRLTGLTIQNTSKIDLDFIAGLATLARLKLRLCFPVEQSEFMKLIRTSKYLFFIDIAYVVDSPDSIRRDELSKFKREVNDCLENELKRPAIEFRIVINKKKDVGTFIRYILKKKIFTETYLMDDGYESVMYKFCEYVSTNQIKSDSDLIALD